MVPMIGWHPWIFRTSYLAALAAPMDFESKSFLLLKGHHLQFQIPKTSPVNYLQKKGHILTVPISWRPTRVVF